MANREYPFAERIKNVDGGAINDILKASKEYGVERHIGENVISDIAGFIHKCG